MTRLHHLGAAAAVTVAAASAVAQDAARPTAPVPADAAGSATPPSSTSSAASAPPAPSSSQAPINVIVAGHRDGRPRRAAEAVENVDTSVARQESADMGAVLDRSKGVVIRRSGSLGAPTTFYLNGMSGKQIRFFIDGVPVDGSALGFGPADLPVNLIERVEVYKGVVPIRFGADALGGAVNFVSRELGSRPLLESAVEIASYGTIRNSTIGVVPLSPEAGLYTRAQAYVDRSDNDYKVDVKATNQQGKQEERTVPRFHDAYQAYGVGAEVGFRNRPWADRLSFGVQHARNDKELQSNLTMTVPYGDVTLGQQATAATLRYLRQDRRGSPVGIDLLFNYADRDGYVTDQSRNIWNWDGEVIGARAIRGERGTGSLVRTGQQTSSGRLNFSFRISDCWRLELNTTPTASRWQQNTRSLANDSRPWVMTHYGLGKIASGVSLQARVIDRRLDNDLFAKHYFSHPDGPPGSGMVQTRPADPKHYFGAGDSARFAILPELFAKASYEYAIRIPEAYELFGDGALVSANAALLPETSHNVNAGLALNGFKLPGGALSVDSSLFARRTRDLIFLSVALDSAQYQNISDVDTNGVEGGITWKGWDFLTLSANGTYLKAVSRSTGGWFGRFNGDRIPNLPYLFGNLSASVSVPGTESGGSKARLYWYGHYVHEYFLFWESEGDPSYKLRIPGHFLQTVGVSATHAKGMLITGLEVKNITDTRNYDNVGQQLMGRSWHFKTIINLD